MISKYKQSYPRALLLFYLSVFIAFTGLFVPESLKAAANYPSVDTQQMHRGNSKWAGKKNVVNTAPVITLNGASSVSYSIGGNYIEEGALCTDTQDGVISVPAPIFSPALDMNTEGTYIATYTCTDSSAILSDTATRTVYVNSISTEIAFNDTTVAVMPDLVVGQNPVLGTFEADLGHMNDDMCLDMLILSHGGYPEERPDGIYYQDNVGGACQGTYTWVPNDHWNTENRRMTSWVMLFDLDGDGDTDILGGDVDGNPSLAAMKVNGVDDYLAATGCLYSVDRCLPIDFNNDGDVELISAPLVGLSFNDNVLASSASSGTFGAIYSWPEKTVLWTPDWASINEPNLTRAWATSLVFDANNDSYPDIVNPQLNLIWFNSPSGFNTPAVYGNFTASGAMFDTQFSGLDSDQHSNPHQQIFFDYDNDGDLDIFKVRHHKGSSPTVITVDAANQDGDPDSNGFWLLENNGSGVFTDVSLTEMAGLTLSAVSYQSSYAGLGVGDFNNDGLTDLRADWLTGGGFDAPCGILVNGGTGNWTKVSVPCHYYDSTDDGRVATTGGGAKKTIVTHGDYDNDGRLDLVSSNAQRTATKDSVAVWRNVGNYDRNWLSFVVKGAPTTDGFHTRVTMKVPGTSTILCTREIYIAEQFGAANEHCGLGNNPIVDIDMQLPGGGALVQFVDVPTDRNVALYSTGQIVTINPGATKPPATYVATLDFTTTMTLVADTDITPTSTELVTFALPFAQGDVNDLADIKVSIGGTEVAAAVSQGMTWWADGSVRSATIQLQNIDMTAGNVVVTITDDGKTLARNNMQPHSNGWTNAGANKNNLPYPRIFALHEKQYLADSNLIPPYIPAPDIDDSFETYQVAQFNNNFGALDYSASLSSNWLFDRSSAMFKVYMTTGRVEFLKEAFLAKQFYFNYVKNDGTTPTAAGGDGCWTYGGVACSDSKYIAPQQAKLSLALTGDNSQWDDSLIIEMALQADLGWSQYGTRDPFDSENEGFTERGAGLTGLAEIIAYEMTGNATILSNLNERIASLKDMQQTEFSWDIANGWTPKSGGFTHNIDVHEGNSSQGSAALGNTNARGFSAWMSENIVDFLWHTYWSVGNSDIPEMLRLLANAVDDYGFSSVYNPITMEHDELPEFTALLNPVRTQGCNTTGDDTSLVYMASAYADDATRTSGDWYPWYSDNHNIEVALIYAAGMYFESDQAKKDKLLARADKLVEGWSGATSTCATIFSNVYRLFNWQHRSNSVRTLNWVKGQ